MFNALLLPFAAIFALQLALFLFSAPKGPRVDTAERAAWRGRLRLAGGLILAAGLPIVAVVHHHAAALPDAGGDVIGYDVGAGYSTPITAGSTKRYELQMEQIGGKGNAAIAEFRDWCGDRWRGRNLAPTLAVLFAGAGLGCFILARLLAG
jgi:hypothetical protein